LSDSSYYDDNIIGADETDPTWEEDYPYVDDSGLLYSEEDAQAMIASGEYYVEEPGLPHPDEVTDFGVTLRQLWDTLPENDRKAARESYAVQKYRELKEQG
jgi:hypothetical protein